MGFSLSHHPLALLRGGLEQIGIRPLCGVLEAPDGEYVRTAGLVITRQRPASASGVTFVTLEDEASHVNVIVWRQLAERQRPVLLGARLLGVVGRVQKQGEVVHLIAQALEDYSSLLNGLLAKSRDFH
jgi:error-prone DNA polymerase